MVVLDDIHMYMQHIKIFLYHPAINFCVGLPLKRNTVGSMFVVSLYRIGWWVGGWVRVHVQ